MNPFDKGQQQQLGDWHPRQRMSGDSISQWSQWCIDADVIRRPAGPHGSTESDNLGTRVANEHLRESYVAFCKQQGASSRSKYVRQGVYPDVQTETKTRAERMERAATARLRRTDG